jgi:prolipoprotein diacylglyceryl transferase
VSLAAIPSPTRSVWHLGPLPIRAYALCIILGIIAACVITEVRMRRRGAPPSLVLDIAVWAVPAGIIGARIYHVLTTPAHYFGADGDPLRALKIWEGGLGIWGAVAGGAVGGWIACRRLGVPLTFVMDAAAPALPVAQAIGRWGNWFNNELYGKQTDLPWALRIYEFDAGNGEATRTATGELAEAGLYHPTFLYESLWNLGVAAAVWLFDRKHNFGRGRAFALYVMLYSVGRFWVEALRTDEAAIIGGLRLNNWTAIIVFLAALAYFVRVKGPQEQLIVDEDGTIRVAGAAADVPAAATPASDALAAEPAADAAADPDAPPTDKVDIEKPGKEKPDKEESASDEPASDEPASDEPAATAADAEPAGTGDSDSPGEGSDAGEPAKSRPGSP